MRRTNALTTTFLDLLGTLLFAGAAGYAAWTLLAPWAGMMGAGVVVTALSALAQRRAQPRPVRLRAVPDEDEAPGPTSPGNLHVMGR